MSSLASLDDTQRPVLSQSFYDKAGNILQPQKITQTKEMRESIDHYLNK